MDNEKKHSGPQPIAVFTAEERALAAVSRLGAQMRMDAEKAEEDGTASLIKNSIATHRGLLEKLAGRDEDHER